MNKHSLLPRYLCRVALATALVGSLSARAGLQIPYAPDAATLHLWHLDDPNGASATDTVATASITLTNIGLPNPPATATNVVLGAPSFLGQGTCLVATNKQHLLYGGSFTDVSQFCNPDSGAFTFEAIARFDTPNFNPVDAEIVCGDNGAGITGRGWQWRIFNGVMEWDLLAGSTDNDFKANLPTTGPDSAIVGTWYHLAVTYTGNNPTNGDPANVITFYWTLLDANRTYASKLGQFTATRPLSGSPQGAATPNLGIGGSGRQTTTNPGNNEGLIGALDEVRISNVARRSNEMAFIVGGPINPPTFTRQPPATSLVGYGQTLTLPALVSGTPTLMFQWQHAGTNIPGQTDTTLLIQHPTFADGGNYQVIVTNQYGSKTSTVAQVTIGAAPTGLFNTGLDTNGVISAGDIVDPHWTVARSADPNHLGADSLIFEYSFPIQFADPNGSFSPTNGVSMWTGLGGNQGGVVTTSPAGQYYYRARFLLDTADPATMTMGGNFWVNGTVTNILVNGISTPVTQPTVGTLYVAPFALTNGFKAGWNTIDFVENLTSAGASAVRVEISGVGQALPPGLPSIIEQPADQTVRDVADSPNTNYVEFAVAALGRPPLTYQWWADGVALPGATYRTLDLADVSGTAHGTNYAVVVSNDSGSITSRVATLSVVATNQPPVPLSINLVTFSGQTFTLQLSDLLQQSVDADGDPIYYAYADSSSTNGAANGLGNVVQTGATLVYTPVDGYVGADQFTYTITDQIDNSLGYVNILELSSPQPTNNVVAPGSSASFTVGVTTPPAGYSFQWQFDGTNIVGQTTGQLNIANAQVSNAGSYTLVVTDPQHHTWTSPIGALTVGTPGTGTGLTGDYYGYANGTTNFTGVPTLTEVDPVVDFNWGTSSPDPSLPVDGFQVRWHGQVQPLYSDTYTFYTTTDDGARLWVNGKQLVNQWQNQAATTASGTIALQAYQKYDIVMEYYENTSTASARLSWSSAHQALQTIPMTQLYPGAAVFTPTLSAGLGNRTNLVINWSGTFTLQSSPNVTGPWTPVANSTVSPYTVPLAAAQKMFFRLVEPISQ